jgi:hypothetical protein
VLILELKKVWQFQKVISDSLAMSIFAIFGKKSLLNKPASIKMDDISMSYM